jgi:hypothetical protein
VCERERERERESERERERKRERERARARERARESESARERDRERANLKLDDSVEKSLELLVTRVYSINSWAVLQRCWGGRDSRLEGGGTRQ